MPEKTEATLPATTPAAAEEPPAPGDGESLKETASAPIDRADARQEAAEEKPPPAGVDEASPETEAEPAAPVAPMRHLEIAAEGNKEVEEEEKEVDTGEIPSNERAGGRVSEAGEEKTEESEEEDQYKHLKVTLTLPEQKNAAPNEEKPPGKDNINVNNEKVPDQAKDAGMRDSDNRTADLNLSISSFLSKAKEPASVSVQVIPTHESYNASMLR